MRREERGQPRRIAARHAAFGGDAVDARMAPRRGEARRIAGRVVVMDEAEIEFGLGAEAQIFERREIGVVGAAPSAPADGRTGSGA